MIDSTCAKDKVDLDNMYRMIESMPEAIQAEIGLTIERIYANYKARLIAQEQINYCIVTLRRNGLLDKNTRLALGLIKPDEQNIDDESSNTIYFIESRDAGLIKIGFTTNPDRRIKSLKTASPNKLRVIMTMPGTREDERKLHEKFAHLRQQGEWFTDCDELRNHIHDLIYT